jgi:hypothetical protein
MARTTPRRAPSLDVLESRELLSTATPLLSQHALNGVVRDVRAIMGSLARTEDAAQAGARLTRLSSRLPYGEVTLAPAWQNDLGFYRPGSTWSLMATRRQILGDLYRYVQGGFVGGNGIVTGQGSTGFNPGGLGLGSGGTTNPTPIPPPGYPGPGNGGTTHPLPTISPDSVRIENTTGLELQVTVYLETSHTPQPYLTEIIPAQWGSIALFNFGSATGAFMSMNVSLSDGGQTPPPFDGVALSQPLTGYNGALFDISLFGDTYFNVNPL